MLSLTLTADRRKGGIEIELLPQVLDGDELFAGADDEAAGSTSL